MSFFGLTYLGLQNSFQSFLNDRSYLHIFEVKDVEHAFQKVSSNGTLQNISLLHEKNLHIIFLVL